MDNEITTIQQDAAKLAGDVAGAIDRAESWAEKILTGGIEARVLGSFATEIVNAMRAIKADVDAIAARLEPTAPAAAPAGGAQA